MTTLTVSSSIQSFQADSSSLTFSSSFTTASISSILPIAESAVSTSVPIPTSISSQTFPPSTAGNDTSVFHSASGPPSTTTVWSQTTTETLYIMTSLPNATGSESPRKWWSNTQGHPIEMVITVGGTAKHSGPTVGSVMWIASAVSIGTVVLVLLSLWHYRKWKRTRNLPKEEDEFPLRPKDDSDTETLYNSTPQYPPGSPGNIETKGRRNGYVTPSDQAEEYSSPEISPRESLEVIPPRSNSPSSTSGVSSGVLSSGPTLGGPGELRSKKQAQLRTDISMTVSPSDDSRKEFTRTFVRPTSSFSLESQGTAPPMYYSPPTTPFGQRIQIRTTQPDRRQSHPDALRPGPS